FQSLPPNPYPSSPILVAEDNKVNQKLILTLLTKLGVAAEIANNGKEVINPVTKNSYSLILMDIEMPEMDGITATKEIRRLLPLPPPPLSLP
ncbi:MAG TPA: response regulator, partial [Geminocystis sp. M7585_C2015_104]|nr:response regulator [Geminocystis sp. M7585_C2015_104]